MHYLNEFDAGAAEWLRELMKDRLIPEGAVDARDIREVQGTELARYSQCHFFAGIGGWSEALRVAGWPEDEPVWTGSCPCQPFSAAGKRRGTKDERHLWPEFRRLIAECRPATIFGEQVASRDGRDWLAGVRADLEDLGYAVGAADLCVSGTGPEAEGRFVRGGEIAYERIAVGAPHIRQRLYWVATLSGVGQPANAGQQSPREHLAGSGTETNQCASRRSSEEVSESGRRGVTRGLDDPNGTGSLSRRSATSPPGHRRSAVADGKSRADGVGHPVSARLQERVSDGGVQREAGCTPTGQAAELRSDSDAFGVFHPESVRRRSAARLGETGEERPAEAKPDSRGQLQNGPVGPGGTCGLDDAVQIGRGARASEIPAGRDAAERSGSGFWSAFDLVVCRDAEGRNKARRVEPGSFPLADGLPGRVGLLRGYGNAINPHTAAVFVRAFLETEKCLT